MLGSFRISIHKFLKGTYVAAAELFATGNTLHLGGEAVSDRIAVIQFLPWRNANHAEFAGRVGQVYLN